MINVAEFLTPKSVADARAEQESLRHRLKLQDDFDRLEIVGGIDVGYDMKNNVAYASIVTLSLNNLKLLEQIKTAIPVSFPYIPGLLSFREIPAILAALKNLSRMPDLLMVDGQGIAHPRRMGIATHLGILLDMPTIGVAKSKLVGDFTEPGISKGNISPLMHENERIGSVLRSKEKTNPLFISPGHRISLDTAVRLTMECLTRYRLPEPTRMADKYSKHKAPIKRALL